MRNFKLTLEYDGSSFHGFQIQNNGNTIQAELERAIEKLLGEKIRISSSGRTDTGVHALGHVINFKSQTRLPIENLLKGLNRYLPPAIAVIQAEEVPLDFHAQYSAKSKIYDYRIHHAKIRSPLLAKTTYRYPYTLDCHKITKALALIKGRHDFRAFASKTAEEKNTMRMMKQARLIKKGTLLILRFEADGFLYNMVRNLVGTLLLVGTGKMTVPEFRKVLQSRDRKQAGPLAPAQGLVMVQVKYA